MSGAVKRLKPFEVPMKYVFTDPDTSFQYDEPTKEALFKRIINYRAQNRLDPIEALDVVLENYWCGRIENAGKCDLVKLKRGWYHYIRGGIALLENIFLGEANMVSQEIADARSEVCGEYNGRSKCEFNIFPDKDGFIKWSDELAEATTGGKKSSNHDNLGNCELCTCTLKAKVWSKEVKLDEKEREKAPSYCWAK